jgi:hypothetical protein
MQTRKVEVEIKTVDEKHCAYKKESCQFISGYYPAYCILDKKHRKLGIDGTGYIRTASCIKAEKGEG